MKRSISFLIVILIFAILAGCSASKKNYNELKGLMLLDNLQLSRNKAFHSRHNIKTKKVAYKKFKKNNRASYNVKRD